MTHPTEAMMRTSPGADARTAELTKLAACIDACFACAQSCTLCANACLGERQIDTLRHCIRLDEDCADLCLATGQIMSRLHEGVSAAVLWELLHTCAAACAECATECEARSAIHAHCKLCAESCRRCEAACMAVCAS